MEVTMPGTRVTCTDIDTGDTETRVIEDRPRNPRL